MSVNDQRAIPNDDFQRYRFNGLGAFGGGVGARCQLYDEVGSLTDISLSIAF